MMNQEFAGRRTRAIALMCACTGTWFPFQLLAGDFGGSVAATTDYVYRGLSLTRGAAALQADFHYQTTDRWVVGAWASTIEVSPRQGRSVEIDLYAGREWTLTSDWDARVGVTHYAYPNDSSRLNYEYDEIAASLTYQSRLSATIGWSPNVSLYSNGWVADSEAATSYEVTASQPLRGRLAAAAGVGYYDLPDVLRADYWFWNVGVNFAVGRAQLGLMYIDTDSAAVRAFGSEVAANGWSGSLSWRF